MTGMSDALREALIGPPPGASEGPLWVTPGELAGCVPVTTTVDLLDVCTAVSDNLFVLSGRRYRQRLVTVRPSRRVASRCGWWLGIIGDWEQTPDAWPAWDWNAGADELRLSGPVQSVRSVKIDGRELSAGEVSLYDGRYLVRVNPSGGGSLGWPEDQRLDLADTEPGTFSVTYQWGQAQPAGGRISAHAWACYMANQLHRLTTDGDCDLSDRVTQMVRQGTTLTALSALDFLREGKVGIDVVDQWLHVVNPNGSRRRASITNPDDIHGRRPA